LITLSAGSRDRKFVTANHLRKAAEDLKQIKERSYQLMQLKANSQVLDVGCGPAIDTIPLSEYIGDEGQIVGIDSDPNMVMKANLEVEKRQIAKRIKHMQSDAQRLPFSDSQFDGVHAERLFQVLPKSNAEPVFAEMTRVLKHNGRIVLVDADWGSASVNFSDYQLERKLLTFFALKMRPNGFAGRELLELLNDSNYKEITVEVFPFVARDFSKTPFGEWLSTEALENKVAAKKEIDLWNKELTEKTVKGTFLYHGDMIITAGTKHGP
jgi:ubiquinone/menaquinone biosynthesis C-methylase UbiE